MRSSSTNSWPGSRRAARCWNVSRPRATPIIICVSSCRTWRPITDSSKFMFRIPGIRYVRSNVVLKEIKTGVALPF
ncbi:hypothetical protein ACVIWV_009515 [Bradyrhizobium diazoefficiens]